MPRLLSVLRIVAALLFIEHGTQKLFGFPIPPPAPVHLGTLFGTAGLIEIAGGTLLLLGLLTRPAAFILSGEMATAFFLQHLPRGFWPLQNGGELAVLYCFLFLFIVAAGPGVWSLDAVIRSARADRAVHGSSFAVHGSRP
jgi:putative oxidoreductase